jgi:hypothetical protein
MLRRHGFCDAVRQQPRRSATPFGRLEGDCSSSRGDADELGGTRAVPRGKGEAMHVLKAHWQSMVVVVTVAVVAGCSSPTSPGVHPEITNVTDNFQYQVTGVRNYTHEATYAWQNTGTMANVNQATAVTGGSAMLVLLDADGVVVYSRSLAENGTLVSAVGVAGSWTIRVTYSAANATVNFRVQKTT